MPEKLIDTTGLNAKVSGSPGNGVIGQPRDVTKTRGPDIDIVNPVPPYSSYDILLSHEMDEMELLKSQFLSWYEKETDTTWTTDLPPCPIKLVQDPQTREWKIPDTYPPERKHELNKPGPLTPFEIKYHPGAEWQIRSKQKKGSKHGQQCCYTLDGNLIEYDRTNPEKTIGAGTPDKVSPTNVKTWWAHQEIDVWPFDWAYELDTRYGGGYKYRKMYMEVRPPNTGGKS